MRSRKAETAAVKQEAKAAVPTVVGQGGKAPWEESEEMREKRRQAALARKAARAAKRAAQEE